MDIFMWNDRDSVRMDLGLEFDGMSEYNSFIVICTSFMVSHYSRGIKQWRRKLEKLPE